MKFGFGSALNIAIHEGNSELSPSNSGNVENSEYQARKGAENTVFLLITFVRCVCEPESFAGDLFMLNRHYAEMRKEKPIPEQHE